MKVQYCCCFGFVWLVSIPWSSRTRRSSLRKTDWWLCTCAPTCDDNDSDRMTRNPLDMVWNETASHTDSEFFQLLTTFHSFLSASRTRPATQGRRDWWLACTTRTGKAQCLCWLRIMSVMYLAYQALYAAYHRLVNLCYHFMSSFFSMM